MPNQAIRHLAYARLREQGQSALPAIGAMWRNAAEPILRARSLWLLGTLGSEGRAFVTEALSSADPRFRILGLRVLDLYFHPEFPQASKPLWKDVSPQVRREVAVLMRQYPMELSGDALEVLARQYDGKDRWYLEALGIGMTGKESAMAARLDGKIDARSAKLLWRLRAPETLDKLTSAAHDRSAPLEAAEAIVELNGEGALHATTALVKDSTVPVSVRVALLERMSKRLFSEWTPYRADAEVAGAVSASLSNPDLRKPALALAEQLEDPRHAPALAAMAGDASLDEPTRVAAIAAVSRSRQPGQAALLESLSANGPLPIRVAAIRALGSLRPPGIDAKLQQLLLTKEDNAIRSEALRVLARSTEGAAHIMDLAQKDELPAELKMLATNLLNSTRDPAIRARAAKVLPPPAGRNNPRMNPRFLVFQSGDAVAGRKVFLDKANANCAGCHALDPGKPTVGPNLAAIGGKLGKEAILDSILNPSAGIAHEYVTWILDTKTQGQVIGILAEDTAQRVVVKNEQGEEVRLRPADIVERRKSNLSMMPEDLVTKMTEQELVNLLEYLMTLKERPRAAAR